VSALEIQGKADRVGGGSRGASEVLCVLLRLSEEMERDERRKEEKPLNNVPCRDCDLARLAL
jgi:hypothetical protein